MNSTVGTYSISDWTGLSLSCDIGQPIEGLREGWQDRLVANGLCTWRKVPGNKETQAFRKGYRAAIAQLMAEFSPGAVCRSLPIARLENHLARVLSQLTPVRN